MLHTDARFADGTRVSFEQPDLDAIGYLSISTDALGVLGLTYLFLQSYWNNRRRELTGRLYYDGMQYGVILEGEPQQIQRASWVIERDGRHEIHQTFHVPNIDRRHYDDWRMYFDGAETVARVLPNYRHAIGENNGQSAKQVVDLMKLYRT